MFSWLHNVVTEGYRDMVRYLRVTLVGGDQRHSRREGREALGII